MRSMLKQLQLGERSQDLLSFVDAAMKKEEHKIVMETHYSQELSLLYILQEDYDRAKYYANSCMQVFMQVSFDKKQQIKSSCFTLNMYFLDGVLHRHADRHRFLFVSICRWIVWDLTWRNGGLLRSFNKYCQKCKYLIFFPT